MPVTLRRLALATLSPILIFGASSTLAGATPSETASTVTAVVTQVGSGQTALVSSPAATYALLRNGIVPFPSGPAQERLVLQPGGLGLRADFPVTEGSVDMSALQGDMVHAGGLTFFSFVTFKYIDLSRFVIVLDASPHLDATLVNGQPAALRVFDLDLSSTTVATSGGQVAISNIVPTFTTDAAVALDTILGTGVFVGGMAFGTASSVVVPTAA